jgi:hypothetical protein
MYAPLILTFVYWFHSFLLSDIAVEEASRQRTLARHAFKRRIQHAVQGNTTSCACSTTTFTELLTQWHASLSQVDLKWTEDQFNQHFGRKLPERISPDDLERVRLEYQSNLNSDPRKRSFSRFVSSSFQTVERITWLW